MNNIPKGYEDIDDDKPQGFVNMGDEYAGLEDENAAEQTPENKEEDPDAYRDNLEDR